MSRAEDRLFIHSYKNDVDAETSTSTKKKKSIFIEELLSEDEAVEVA